MESCSQYFCDLSTVSRERYKKKVASTGLKDDPYTIKDWKENPDVFPDLVVYMTATPSQFTCEAIKVSR